ncbi:unnamed protein product [Scytosiphon promiscuus]
MKPFHNPFGLVAAAAAGSFFLQAAAAATAAADAGGGSGKDPASSAAASAPQQSFASPPAASLLESAKAVLECHVCKTSQLTGTVDDCCVDYSTVDTATKTSFTPLLTSLQKRNFFKYFKVNLEKECPFWEEDGQCMMKDCSVCECSPDEIPKPWLEEDERSVAKGAVDVQPGDDCSEQIRKEKACQENSETERDFGKVDHSQSSPVEDEFNPWSEAANAAVWALQEEGGEGFEYVNLDLNPEKFTGYSGASAARVWGSIYWENLKGYQDNACMEKRILFRLLSGLHSSIMTQIANDYRFDDGTWGPNTQMFVNAVGMHPDRLTNMYFAYVFVLRAIGKASPFLMAYDYDTGNEEDDKLTRQLIHELASAEQEKEAGMVSVDQELREHDDAAVPMCLRGFDEKGLFETATGGGGDSDVVFDVGQAGDSMALKQEFMHKFHNISRIMDCVGCEKCKLWGKLETLGLGTALKIMLFSSDAEGKKELASLSRNELIALVNTAAQLAKSVGSVPEWRWLEVKQKGAQVATRVGLGVILAVAAVVGAGVLLGKRGAGGGGGSSSGGSSSSGKGKGETARIAERNDPGNGSVKTRKRKMEDAAASN